jgi:hypothetical protein
MIWLKDRENKKPFRKKHFLKQSRKLTKFEKNNSTRRCKVLHGFASPANTRSEIPQLMAPSYITRILAMSEVNMHTKVQVERCLQDTYLQNGFRWIRVSTDQTATSDRAEKDSSVLVCDARGLDGQYHLKVLRQRWTRTVSKSSR